MPDKMARGPASPFHVRSDLLYAHLLKKHSHLETAVFFSCESEKCLNCSQNDIRLKNIENMI